MVHGVQPGGAGCAVLTGVIEGPELVHHALELGAAGFLALPLLLDARAARLRLSPAEIARLSNVVGGMRRVHGQAPVALLTEDEDSYQVATDYGVLVRVHNPDFAAFRSAADAVAWVRPRPRCECTPLRPELIGWARVHPAHVRRRLRLDSHRWYPLIEQPPHASRPPRQGYVWLDDDGQYRQVWAGCLEIRESRGE
jgi:hypothetical protein